MNRLIVTLILIILLSPASSQAMEVDVSDWLDWGEDNDLNETVIETNVNVSVDTGGNQVEEGGQVTTGDYRVEVNVANEVNGQTAEPINIKIDSSQSPTSYTETKETGSHRTTIDVSVNSEDKIDNEASTTTEQQNQADAADPGPIQKISRDLRDDLVGFFQQLWQKIFSIFK